MILGSRRSPVSRGSLGSLSLLARCLSSSLPLTRALENIPDSGQWLETQDGADLSLVHCQHSSGVQANIYSLWTFISSQSQRYMLLFSSSSSNDQGGHNSNLLQISSYPRQHCGAQSEGDNQLLARTVQSWDQVT